MIQPKMFIPGTLVRVRVKTYLFTLGKETFYIFPNEIFFVLSSERQDKSTHYKTILLCSNGWVGYFIAHTSSVFANQFEILQ